MRKYVASLHYTPEATTMRNELISPVTTAVVPMAARAQDQQTAGHGPFGFWRGMTKEQAIEVVGEGSVVSAKDDFLLLSAAPNPHPHFVQYGLFISPEHGTLKVTSFGRDIQTNCFGDAIREAFIDIRDAVSKIYGNAKTYDLLYAGSIWNEPRDWMAGLLKEERVLSAYWDLSPTRPNQITFISLIAKAPSTDECNLILGYEFDGWAEYLDSTKVKAASAF